MPKGKKGIYMIKANKGYAINHNDKEIVLTKAFVKQSSIPGTKEFRELSKLHKNFPDYDIVKRTATITADKNTHNGLSIEMIEKIIARQPNAAELKREYDEFVAFWGKEVKDKKTGKTVIRAPYGKVKSWFLKKVPNYQEIGFSQGVASAENND